MERTARSAQTGSEVFLSEHDLAARHKVSVKSLRNQRVQGTGVAYLKLGASVRYRLADIEAFEEAHRRTSTSTSPKRRAAT
jgi:hypothetical protein